MNIKETKEEIRRTCLWLTSFFFLGLVIIEVNVLRYCPPDYAIIPLPLLLLIPQFYYRCLEYGFACMQSDSEEEDGKAESA